MRREQMAALVATIHDGTRRSIGEVSRLISEAGVGNTWLGHCLLYEGPAASWAAWSQETYAPGGEPLEASYRRLREMGIDV